MRHARSGSGAAVGVAISIAALGAVFAAAPLPAVAEDGDDVLKLYDEFVSSGAAASQCASPSNQLAIRFLSNFQWISTHAVRELGRRLPERSADEVASELALRSRRLKDDTHAMVKSHGCDSLPVQQLVQRFIAQSTWVREGA